MSDRECHHDRSIESTLHTAFTDKIDGWQLWWVYCDACGKKTELCLTWQEATGRALKEWWTNEQSHELEQEHAFQESTAQPARRLSWRQAEQGAASCSKTQEEGGGRMSEFIIDMGSSSYQSTSGLLCADVSQLHDEIVRCRDCKYFDPYTGSCARRDYVAPMAVEADDFCSRGERE